MLICEEQVQVVYNQLDIDYKAILRIYILLSNYCPLTYSVVRFRTVIVFYLPFPCFKPHIYIWHKNGTICSNLSLCSD